MKSLLWLACLAPLWLPAQSGLLRHAHQNTAARYEARLKPFYHGVASGDPLSDRVIIWTRLTPDSNFTGNSRQVSWYVATDTAMSNIVRQGFFTTDSARDYTVKVDVDSLQPATTYYYMFSHQGRNSLRGRTKTLPVGNVNRLKFGVVSCSNYEAGFFNAYGRLADRNDLDAILHLGDYIYEYEKGVYGDTATGRFHQNFETISKDQYRARYSLYRLDRDLRRAHQQHPFINIWDDHETANDAWTGGAENHDSTEGSWSLRKDRASDVFFEWLPIRDQASKQIYRQFNFGNLVNLIMLDTRLEGRQKQINDVNDPALYSPNRTLLGNSQRNWFTSALSNASAQWRIVGNQVIFAQLQLGWASGATGQTPQQIESQFLDIWDGYPAERQKIIRHLGQNQIDNTVFLTGDFHSTFAFDIADTVVDESNFWAPVSNYVDSTGAGSQAVEFATPSVSSANFDENIDPATAAAFEAQINAPLPSPLPANNPNPHLKFVDLDRHGYFVLDITADSAKANYYYTAIDQPSSQENFARALKTVNGQNHLVPAVESQPKAQSALPAPASLLQGSITTPEQGLEVFMLYPNPAQHAIHLQLGSPAPKTVQGRILDLQGKTIRRLAPQTFQGGVYEWRIPVTQLAPGAYFLQLTTGGESRSYKFLVR
ncbi:MAG: alkaline phosphatase D family protein [Schleiferiaceae bacterium]|nr:alkaline phosphatase D family protein [Schleiferiaceae bacterium]MDR9442320.1 alkaline phosphatase D family protein [Schleiferiaceae bacterium]